MEKPGETHGLFLFFEFGLVPWYDQGMESGVMKSFLVKSSVLLVLASFVVAKALFWIALLPIGNSTSTSGNWSSSIPAEISHPCACTGAAICNCGPGGCCEGEASPEIAQTESGPQIHSPTFCGRLSQGAGFFGEMPCLTQSPGICHFVAIPSNPCFVVVVDLLSGRTDCPASPPPKA